MDKGGVRLEHPIIKTVDVVHSFGRNLTLKNLTLNAPSGISGFIGRNGSGKTTTIGVLLGLIKPQSGKATFFGRDCWKDSIAIRKRVGVMHEINAYPVNFKGGELLEFVAKIYDIPNSAQSIRQVLGEVGLEDARDKPIKTYSAGMLRRLGLAQALIGEPEFVILDEPTANVDPLGRVTLLDNIKKIHDSKGTSFLISTHILSDLEKICNWIIIIDEGRIVEQGYVKDLAEKYSANVYKIQVSNPWLFAGAVQELAMVQNTTVNNQTVLCKVNDTKAFYQVVPKLVADLKLELIGLQQISGTLEEIYKHAIGVKSDDT
ncbi:MAG: ABC transporter ATP-binding protein [Candidatus Bathyarchaeota archaeon]|nr:ABC transporter ATP-binding protein [Candidatus Bathyarchaeota archaeon]